MNKLLHILGFHSYDKWVDIETGNLLRSEDQVIIGKYYIQRAICIHCNKKKYKKDKFYLVKL